MPGARRNQAAWPRVSDYGVETETDFELFQGQIRAVAHAGPLHSQQLNQVSFVLRPHVTRSHGVDLFLLTRQDAGNNFASDISIRKDGLDPDTDDRYLEELAFEIKSTLVPDELEQRVRVMAARGVRRIFAIPVRGDAAGSEIIAGPVAEWIAAEERWRTYRDDEVIADPCLFQPVPVRALLDAVEADDAVAQALLGKENPVLIKYGDTRARRALQKVLQLLLRDRGIVIDTDADARIDACSDLEILQRWLARAVLVASANELFGDE
jgi:hypothetical protein